MAKEKLRDWNILDGLKNDKQITAYLEVAFQEGGNFFMYAVGDAIRARDLNAMAKRNKVTRESLYSQFSERSKPSIEVAFKTIKELGLMLSITQQSKKHKELQQA